MTTLFRIRSAVSSGPKRAFPGLDPALRVWRGSGLCWAFAVAGTNEIRAYSGPESGISGPPGLALYAGETKIGACAVACPGQSDAAKAYTVPAYSLHILACESFITRSGNATVLLRYLAMLNSEYPILSAFVTSRSSRAMMDKAYGWESRNPDLDDLPQAPAYDTGGLAFISGQNPWSSSAPDLKKLGLVRV